MKNAQDRKLGAEWADWDGNHATESHAPEWVFLTLAGGTVSLLGLLVWAGVWLIWPRLQSLNLTWLGSGLALGVSAYLVIWYASLISAIWGYTGVRFLVRWLGGILWTISPAVYLGRLFGISRDRVGHSFMLVHNRLEIMPPMIHDAKRLLVILPRCLGRSVYQGLEVLKARYGFTQVVVAGGSEARRAIGQTRPHGVVAIACERDLLSGVKDVRSRVPVLAFSNRRPEGPCKQTDVDLGKIEAALRMFLGTPNTNHESFIKKHEGGA